MTEVATLIAKQHCTELVFRAARAIDRCDADLLRSVFHPDATDDHGLFTGSAEGFISWVMPVLRTMTQTQHSIGQTLIEIDGDRAAGESYFTAYHSIAGAEGPVFMIAAGRYLDRFERRDGAWKILHRHAVYDWSSSSPSTDGWDRDTADGKAYGTRGRLDPSYAYLTGNGR